MIPRQLEIKVEKPFAQSRVKEIMKTGLELVSHDDFEYRFNKSIRYWKDLTEIVDGTPGFSDRLIFDPNNQGFFPFQIMHTITSTFSPFFNRHGSTPRGRYLKFDFLLLPGFEVRLEISLFRSESNRAAWRWDCRCPNSLDSGVGGEYSIPKRLSLAVKHDTSFVEIKQCNGKFSDLLDQIDELKVVVTKFAVFPHRDTMIKTLSK